MSTITELEDMAETLRQAGWGVLPPNQYLVDMDDDFLIEWSKVRQRTMISPERGWALAEAVRYVCRNKIQGDFVECGVWKGGACALAAAILHKEEPLTSRKIWLYDTFEGMVSPGDEDRIASTNQPLSERDPEGWWAAGLEEVRRTLADTPLPSDSFRTIQGPVEETLNSRYPDRIAILRLDTDWYESTKKELEVLYPRLAVGGVLIIDDYGHFTGARKAVDEFFSSRGESVYLQRSDYTGRVLIKS